MQTIDDTGAGVAPKRDGFVLGRRASLAVSAGVAAHTLWTSAAPALAYRLYARAWRLDYTATTGIYAVYPIAVVVMLVGFGGLSDQIGRRAAMLAGLGASLVGALLFALAPNVGWVFAARALMGIGVGLSAGPSTAAILEFCHGQDARRAASLTMLAQAGGFAAALLLGGALIQYGPWPTRLCFWVLAVLLAALLVSAWFLQRQASGPASGDWRSRLPSVPKPMRRTFATTAAAMMVSYTFGVLVLSLGGQVEHDLIGSSNALVNGAVMALFPIVLAPVGLAAKGMSSRTALTIGSLASMLGMGLLALAVGRRDLVLYFLATAIAGASYSLLFVGSLRLINLAAPPHHRAGVISALYLVGYLSMGLLALGLGAVATTWGLERAVDLGAGVIAAVSLATLMLALAAGEDEAATPRGRPDLSS